MVQRDEFYNYVDVGMVALTISNLKSLRYNGKGKESVKWQTTILLEWDNNNKVIADLVILWCFEEKTLTITYIFLEIEMSLYQKLSKY